jgi:hypothetical protein
MIWLTIVWSIFTAIFIALGCFYWKMASKSVSHFQVGKNQSYPAGITAQIHLVGIDFKEFVDKFNSYIDYYNQTSKKQNKLQAIGFWVASLVALFSLILTIVS